MNRRAFLALTAASAASGAAAAKIRRITLAPIECRFHKFVAMNSYDKVPKGHTYSNTLVRIQTDQGVEGVGVMGYPTPDPQFHQALKTLIGADPHSLYEMKDGRITGRASAFSGVLSSYRHLDGPLFDLIGKLTSKPAWQLIGPSIRDRVEVYDGTLYFSDVWFSDRGARQRKLGGNNTQQVFFEWYYIYDRQRAARIDKNLYPAAIGLAVVSNGICPLVERSERNRLKRSVF
jgi:L-alanine-DL-glutamate epimerase-like enolase superfamily enzyme